MKELHSESEDQDLEFTQDVTGSHIPVSYTHLTLPTIA